MNLIPHTGSCVLMLWLTACAGTPSLPDPVELQIELGARTDPAVVRAALATLPLVPLQLPVPRYRETLGPPDAETFRALALAHDPAVRLARSTLEERLAAEDLSGRLDGIELGAMTMDIENPDVTSEVQLTFDLLGLLGLGRVAADQALALQQVRASIAQLERAVWQSWFAVEAERLAVAAAHARIDALEDLLELLDSDQRRIQLLEQRGWLAPAQAGQVGAATHTVLHRHQLAKAELGAALSTLAIRTGLAPHDPLLLRITAQDLDLTLDSRVPMPPASKTEDPAPLPMLLDHPAVRAAHLELAVAAAVVDLARARRFPDLRVGPMLTVMPLERLIGAVASTPLPWPGRTGAEIDLAMTRFELQRTVFVDAVAAQRAVVAAAASERKAAEEILATHLQPQEEQSLRHLRAARAQFLAETTALDRYSMAILERQRMLDMVIDARLLVARTRLVQAESMGPVHTGPEAAPR